MGWFLAHLIGDYLCQKDWMAQRKKMSSWVCLFHVVTYMLPFMLLAGWAWYQLLAVGIQHFIQDRTNIIVSYMKWSGNAAFAGPPCAPWSIFLVDNIVHILFMAWVDAMFVIPGVGPWTSWGLF